MQDLCVAALDSLFSLVYLCGLYYFICHGGEVEVLVRIVLLEMYML